VIPIASVWAWIQNGPDCPFCDWADALPAEPTSPTIARITESEKILTGLNTATALSLRLVLTGFDRAQAS